MEVSMRWIDEEAVYQEWLKRQPKPGEAYEVPSGEMREGCIDLPASWLCVVKNDDGGNDARRVNGPATIDNDDIQSRRSHVRRVV
jgi:hypothetical protein